jgi:hypothetical protein
MIQQMSSPVQLGWQLAQLQGPVVVVVEVVVVVVVVGHMQVVWSQVSEQAAQRFSPK